MGETRVNLLHLLEDLRDAYPGSIEETIVTEVVANALDSGAAVVTLSTDPATSTFTVTDNGQGMRRRELVQYHDIATTTKIRGRGIGFAGVGIKLGLLVSDEVFTETRRGKQHVATSWRLSSKRRAPWKWVTPVGLVNSHGTAVRLRLANALSPLVDGGYVEAVLCKQYATLLDPAFREVLSPHYPEGIRFDVNGVDLDHDTSVGEETVPIAVKLPRKHKPSAFGLLTRHDTALPEEQRGIAISTFGKVIKRGWDWLGLTPAEPDLISGLIEAPKLAQCLTLNKADFIKSGDLGALYLSYRKAIQEVVQRQLVEWGLARERGDRDRRRAARPIERDLEKVLLNLADEFPLLSALVERRSGGQRRLPIGVTNEAGRTKFLVGGPEPAAEREETDSELQSADDARSEDRKPTPPAVGVSEPATKGPRRPTRFRLRIQFEKRPEDDELSRLVESTVWINEAHPAFQRAAASRSTGYHIALSTSMALAPLAVDSSEEHEFISIFLARWGEGAKGDTHR